MDRFRSLEVFVAVAEAGAFARAATALNMSPPAVTRAIAALEDRLGVRLLNRTTRRLSLTEAGRRLLENGRRVLGDLEATEREAAGEAATPSGHLTISASLTFGRLALTPLLLGFLRAEPKVTASLRLQDRVVDLVEEGIDLAVRIGQLPDSTLIARRFGEVRRLLVASPSYLARHGRPERPADLKRHRIVGFGGLGASREWRHIENGRPASVALQPVLDVNDAVAALAAAEAGDGISFATSYMAAGPIAAGRLVALLEEFTPPPVPAQIVYPQSRLVAPKVRAFVEFAAPRLSRALDALHTAAV